jgi:hypothetical protein
MEFLMYQVNLAQVRLARVTRYSRTMFDRLAQMRITLYPQPGEEPDTPLIRLSKGVCWATAHGLNCSIHRFMSPAQGGVASFLLTLRRNEAAEACFFLSLSQSLVVIPGMKLKQDKMCYYTKSHPMDHFHHQ